MHTNSKLIYEGKAKQIFAINDPNQVLIKFKDDATAFNAAKKAKFKGKGILNCSISTNIFEYLMVNGIPTHFIRRDGDSSIIAQKINIIPIEVVLRNTAYGSICKQTNLIPGTKLKKPLIDFYFKNDILNDPLLTRERIKLMEILKDEDLNFIEQLTYKINTILKDFFLNIELDLIDFKLEFGLNKNNEIILGDEFSPDNCRLWDMKTQNVNIKSLDKDRFRNDLGDLIEAYTEINKRIDHFMSSP